MQPALTGIYGARILILIKQKCAHRWHISRLARGANPWRQNEAELKLPCALSLALPLDHALRRFSFLFCSRSSSRQTNVWHLAFGAISSGRVCVFAKQWIRTHPPGPRSVLIPPELGKERDDDGSFRIYHATPMELVMRGLLELIGPRATQIFSHNPRWWILNCLISPWNF